MKWIAAIGLLITTNALAQCENNTHILDIVYPKNSSYFSSQYGSKLEQLTKNTQQGAGYLLLEFKVNQAQSTKEAREYNKWLAQRRIDRVKTYLNDAAYPAPVITRLLTASTEENRSVSVVWCPDEREQEVRVASKSE